MPGREDLTVAVTCKEGRRGGCVSLERATTTSNENGQEKLNGVGRTALFFILEGKVNMKEAERDRKILEKMSSGLSYLEAQAEVDREETEREIEEMRYEDSSRHDDYPFAEYVHLMNEDDFMIIF